jgi:hypothetical protein
VGDLAGAAGSTEEGLRVSKSLSVATPPSDELELPVLSVCCWARWRKRFRRPLVLLDPPWTLPEGDDSKRSHLALSHGSENSVTVPSSLESLSPSSGSSSASSRSPAEPDNKLS